jgi:hypothetical protein
MKVVWLLVWSRNCYIFGTECSLACSQNPDIGLCPVQLDPVRVYTSCTSETDLREMNWQESDQEEPRSVYCPSVLCLQCVA